MSAALARLRAPRGWFVLAARSGELVWAWSPDREVRE